MTGKLKVFRNPSSIWSIPQPPQELEYSWSSQVMSSQYSADLMSVFRQDVGVSGEMLLPESSKPPYGKLEVGIRARQNLTDGLAIRLMTGWGTTDPDPDLESVGSGVRHATPSFRQLRLYSRHKPKTLKRPTVEREATMLQLLTVPDIGTPTLVTYPDFQQLLRALRRTVRHADANLSLSEYRFYAFCGVPVQLMIDEETLEVGCELSGKRHRIKVKRVADLTVLQDGQIGTSRATDSPASDDSDPWVDEEFTF